MDLLPGPGFSHHRRFVGLPFYPSFLSFQGGGCLSSSVSRCFVAPSAVDTAKGPRASHRTLFVAMLLSPEAVIPPFPLNLPPIGLRPRRLWFPFLFQRRSNCLAGSCPISWRFLSGSPWSLVFRLFPRIFSSFSFSVVCPLSYHLFTKRSCRFCVSLPSPSTTHNPRAPFFPF